MAANVGLALDEMTTPRPARQTDAVADALRDAVLGAVLVTGSPTASFNAATAARARSEIGTSRSRPPLPFRIRNGLSADKARRGNDTSSVARRPDP